MKLDANSLIELKGDDFLCKKPICPKVPLETYLAYYKDIGLESDVKKAIRLSTREKQCLRLFLDGKSAKETASILGLSRHTIESYFEHIKDKLECWDKRDVLIAAKNLDELCLL